MLQSSVTHSQSITEHPLICLKITISAPCFLSFLLVPEYLKRIQLPLHYLIPTCTSIRSKMKAELFDYTVRHDQRIGLTRGLRVLWRLTVL